MLGVCVSKGEIYDFGRLRLIDSEEGADLRRPRLRERSDSSFKGFSVNATFQLFSRLHSSLLVQTDTDSLLWS